MSPRRALVLLVALLLVVTGAGAAAAVTDPLDGPYPQVHGELVTQLPATPTCTTDITKAYPGGFPFHNTAYGSDPPFTGDYVPTCTGPWSRIVLTMSVKVATGTQFDRIGDVLIGNAEMLHLTTAEGESGETDWTIDRDVTQYASLLTSTQPTYFIIGNQTDGTYTGDFFGSLTLTFYGTGATAPAAVVPDHVESLTPGVDRGDPTRKDDLPLTSAVTIPVSTTTLTAEVFASGHGAEEEDWWNAPFVCASGGIPYREVSIRVDGRLAGMAPVYPTLFTGGYGPDFWRPIPSPRTFDLRPYVFDLSPFIGSLTDGAAHQVDIAIIGQGGCDGYWFLSGNLLETTSRTTTGRTTGGVVGYAGDPLPTSTSTVGVDNQPGTASDMTTSRHHLEVTGTVQAADQVAPTAVRVVQDMTNSATGAALDVDADWTWDSSSTRTTAGQSIADTQSSTYELIRTGPTWSFQDNQKTAHLVNGTTARSTTLTDSMTSAGPVLGVTGVAGASAESWTFSSSNGYCIDHELAGAAQNTVRDTLTACTSSDTGSGAGDPPVATTPAAVAASNRRGRADGSAADGVRRSRQASRARPQPDSLRATG